jgi:hypothetical protein
MRLHVTINQQGLSVDETFTGRDADEVVGSIRSRVARDLPFAMRLVVGSMSNLAFAREVVKRYNDAHKLNLASPTSCQEFITQAQAQGFATIVDP